MRRSTKRKADSSEGADMPVGPRRSLTFTKGARGSQHRLTPLPSRGEPAPPCSKRSKVAPPSSSSSDGEVETNLPTRADGEARPDLPSFSVPISKVLPTSKTPNDYMREWTRVSNLYLNILLEEQCPSQKCSTCHESEVDYRCLDCSAHRYQCWGCCQQTHAQHPLHRVEVWNGTNFEPSWLWSLGAVVYLGHGGSPCPAQPLWPYPTTHPTLPPPDDITYGAKPSTRNLEGCPVLVVVHTNGIHHLPFMPCKCSGCPPLDVQLLKSGFYPATQDAPRTVFTFQLLDLYLVETVECQTATNSFFSKLRRLTNEDFPESAPDRYRELLRVGRQWRHLQELLIFGFANNGGKPKEGDLAIFCAACPQPGINLPDDWEDDPERWLYGVCIVLDGNFVCIHRLLRGHDGDWVWLKGDGEGYLTAKDTYSEHVQTAVETREVSKCYNHRAIADRGRAHKGCDVSGIGAAACGRHGAFVPTSVVNFQKGERQLNMDYALTKAFQYGTIGQAPRIICLYDIGCQYPKNAAARMASSELLMDPTLLEKVTWGIGTWHVHGHKEECFARYSPTFIEGAGNMAGEILESLWSTTNDAGKTSSIMTLPARSEFLDAIMLDNNRKKMRRLIPSLEKKLLESRREWADAQTDFLSLSKSASAQSIRAWTEQMETAEARRMDDVKAMDIYNVKLRKPPSRKAVQTRLMTQEQDRGGNAVGVTKWVMLGIDIQEQQIQVITQVRRSGTSPSESDSMDIATKRERLILRIQEYYSLGDTLFPDMVPPLSEMALVFPGLPYCECDGDDCPHDPSRRPPMVLEKELPEHELIVLASTVQQIPVQWADVRKTEIELRVAQAFTCLEKIRVEVGHKSFLFRSNIRLASAKQSRLRGYAAVTSANRVINLHRTVYHQARTALVRLEAPAETLSTLQPLLPHHVRPLASVYQPNARNQKNSTPSWIWQVDVAGDVGNEKYLEELHRVNWIRARSRMFRWREEHMLVVQEMQRVVSFFEYQARSTSAWGGGLEQTESQRAWATRRSSVWRLLQIHATEVFEDAKARLQEFDNANPFPNATYSESSADDDGSVQGHSPPPSDNDS